MIDKRIDGDAAVDTFSSRTAHDFAAMRLIPFVGKNLDIHIGSVRQVAREAQS